MLLVRNKSLRKLHGLLETGNFLFLKLLLKRRGKASWFPGEVFRAYMQLVGSDRWVCKDILEVFPAGEGACELVVSHLPRADKSFPLHELACLAFLSQSSRASRIFEFGTYSGRSALTFAQNCPEDGEVWTLAVGDAAEGHGPIGVDFRGTRVEHKVRQLQPDGELFDFSSFCGRIDLVFVNGRHDYDSVNADTVNSLQMVRPGGYVVWHDFGNYGDTNGVTRAVLASVPGQQVIQIAGTQLALYQKPASAHGNESRGPQLNARHRREVTVAGE